MASSLISSGAHQQSVKSVSFPDASEASTIKNGEYSLLKELSTAMTDAIAVNGFDKSRR
jgi:hypothetical protein